MSDKIKELPEYLKSYLVTQDYEAYTPVEHATWRYIMRQSREFFKDHAVGVYVEGLEKTGIPIDRIPRITEMDDCLSEFGWGAVGVQGFIPSSVFLDLLARGIMPIATDMRTVEHIGYTPAPDIVHEAAGHAPILVSPAYRKFLQRYSNIAYRAIISLEDIQLYEAIRYLSDIKENPDTNAAEVARAEKRLKLAGEAMTHTSEAGKVARLAWWTIEYGLVGDPAKPKIYGAGLLSSVDESRKSISPSVPKIPLSIDCVQQTYDITEQQPQLFIAESLDHLVSVLDELESSFVFKSGGPEGLALIKKAETVNTAQFDSGVSASGVLKEYGESEDQVDFLQFSGPAQLALNEKVIDGHTRRTHSDGYFCPVGRWQQASDKPPHTLNDQQLREIGIVPGKKTTVGYCNGFSVEGIFKSSIRSEGALILMSFDECYVKRGEKTYHSPKDGPYHLIVGESVRSVFCGPADRASFGEYYVGEASTQPGRTSPFSQEERNIFQVFDSLRDLRTINNAANLAVKLEQLSESVANQFPSWWLAALEITELAEQRAGLNAKDTKWLKNLQQKAFGDITDLTSLPQSLITRGLDIASIAD